MGNDPARWDTSAKCALFVVPSDLSHRLTYFWPFLQYSLVMAGFSDNCSPLKHSFIDIAWVRRAKSATLGLGSRDLVHLRDSV